MKVQPNKEAQEIAEYLNSKIASLAYVTPPAHGDVSGRFTMKTDRDGNPMLAMMTPDEEPDEQIRHQRV